MAKKSSPQLKPKVVIGGILVGCTLFAASLAGLEAVLPSQGHVGGDENYGYVYSGAKSCSVEFNLAADAEDSYLLFGSSELSTSAEAVPQVPANLFTAYDFGFDLTYVGEAYDQSLWHAIALGAYAPSYDKNKVVLIVSPGWFEDGGMDNETFGLRFSYSLYRQFCDNPAISDASKAYVAQRLAAQGIDRATIEAGMRTLPQDYLNDGVLAFKDDLSLRRDLVEVRGKGAEPQDKQAAPSFAELCSQAEAYGQQVSTNPWGIQDTYYDDKLVPVMDSLKDKRAGETYSRTPEYDDLTFFLKVCRETGMDPLVVISPINGWYCDWEGVDSDTRQRCYQRIRTICNSAGVQVADFSGQEYRPYFLCDPVHFGWTGWVAVEEAICGFIGK